MPNGHPRFSELVICAPHQTPAEIGRQLGMPPDEPDSDCWVIRVSGDSASDIDSLTAGVLGRLDASWPSLEAMAVEEGVRIVLRVVAYLSPTDGAGGGISFDTPQLQRLTSIRAVLDLDLYSVE